MGFFAKHSDSKYDIWSGDVAKDSVIRPEMFQGLYGESWQPKTEILPVFPKQKRTIKSEVGKFQDEHVRPQHPKEEVAPISWTINQES
jgi:hypothetical protein